MSTNASDPDAPRIGRRRVLTVGSALVGGAALLPLTGCSDGSGDDALPSDDPDVNPGIDSGMDSGSGYGTDDGAGAIDPGDDACDPGGGPLEEGPGTGFDPAGVDPAVDMVIDFRGRTGPRVDSRFAGLSYEKNELAEPLFLPNNTDLIALFRLLGPALLRIGANQVDRASWRGSVDELTPITTDQVDALAAFVAATGWQVSYGVNLADKTPEDAADEAAYVASALGESLLVWEIGNEPDLYVRLDYRDEDWGYPQYVQEWAALRDAMRAVTPGVPYCGPSTTFDLTQLSLRFAAEQGGDEVPMLTQHYYRADGEDPDVSLRQLLGTDAELQLELDVLVETAAASGMTLGLRYNEANSFYNAGARDISNAFGTALWTLDFMFTCAVAGCAGVNLHGGGSGPGYTPIADRDGEVVEVRPVFYGMLMFAQACPGVPSAARKLPLSNVDYRRIGAWHVARDDGGENIVVINEYESDEIEIGVAATLAAYEPLWLRGEALDATGGHTLGGMGIGTDGSWSPMPDAPLSPVDGRLRLTLPSASAVLLRSV